MNVTYVAKTTLTAGMTTSLGTVIDTKISPSGKTIVIEVSRPDGSTFTDRMSATGNICIFS